MTLRETKSTMTLRELLYEALYAEIRGNSTVVANTLTVTLTAAAGIVGIGVELRQPGLFLAAFILLIPSLSFISSQMESTARIAAYISIKLEGDEAGISWETDFWELRKSDKSRYGLSVSWLFLLIGGTCVAMAWYFLDYGERASVVAVAVASVVGMGLLSVVARQAYRAYSVEQMAQHREAWRTIGIEQRGE